MLAHFPSWAAGADWSPRLALPNPRLFVQYAVLMQHLHGDQAVGDVVLLLLPRVLSQIPPGRLAALYREVDLEAERWLAAAKQTHAPALGNDQGAAARTRYCFE